MGDGEWDEYCAICGGPPRSDPIQCPAGQHGSGSISTDWLNQWEGVTAEHPEKPITLGKYNSNGCWVKPDRSTFAAYGQGPSRIVPHEQRYGPSATSNCSEDSRGYSDSSSDEAPGQWYKNWLHGPATWACNAPEAGLRWLPFETDGYDEGGSGTWARYGVAFHRSCGQLLQQRLGYHLNFNDVWPLLQQRSPCKHDPSNARHAGDERVSSNHLNCSYGGIDRYHRVTELDIVLCEADFAFRFVSAADEYMLLDPLQCSSSNADRIVRTWEPLVKQFQQAAGRGKGSAGSSKKKDKGGGPSHDANAHGGRPGAKGGSSAAAAGARRYTDSQLQDGRKARKQGALARAQAAEKAATVLQLVFSHASSPKDQLTLAAQLLPLSSTTPQLLAGRMQLVAAANTWPKVQQVATWLRRYGGLVASLELDAVVDCCGQDACRANKELSNVMTSTRANFKSLRLVSLSAYLPDSSKEPARKLLRSLPLNHLTSLHLGRP